MFGIIAFEGPSFGIFSASDVGNDDFAPLVIFWKHRIDYIYKQPLFSGMKVNQLQMSKYF